MNLFKYNLTKEEYLRNIELKINNFSLLKIMITINKMMIVVLISLEILILYLNNFSRLDVISTIGIMVIIGQLIVANKTNLIKIKLVKYNLKKRYKLTRKIEWDNNNFKIYINEKIIINSYNNVKNLIESDEFLVINYREIYKKDSNIMIPKEKLFKDNLFERLKENIINNIGENNYKRIDIEPVNTSYIKKRDYALVFFFYAIILVSIILYFTLFI